ncbi:hypothetical protein ACIBCN_00575 [Nocardia sp. NPDC051052]|uniref:hypothetical protein n=1 Tax=Nocardia sp. NPDC051052 TaxID=3364322 RepID=UPI00378FB1DD
MVKRLAALLVMGFAVLFVNIPAPAYAGDDNEKWAKIFETYCHVKSGEDAIGPRTNVKAAHEQFSFKGLRAWDRAYALTPLELDEDPVAYGRSIVFGPDSKFAPPPGSSDWDVLLHWRDLNCNSEEFKAEWRNVKKTLDEKFGRKLKPGYENDAKINELYAEKMKQMREILQGEQQRRGIKDEEWAEIWGESGDKDDL